MYLMYLKEKKSGTIKDYGYANGRKNCEISSNGDASSLMVVIEYVLLTCVVEAE